MIAERGLGLALFLTGCGGGKGVVVNEVMAAAHDVELDGQKVDWIELHNDASHPVDLGGWALSRLSRTGEFVFPELEVPVEGFVIVLAETYEIPGSTFPSTGFDLNRDGDALFLYDDRGSLRDDVYYPDQHADFSWQRIGDGGLEWCHAVAPTPGEANEECMCPDTGGSEWC